MKEYEEGKTKYYAKTRVVTLDKKKLLASLPEKPDDFKSPVKLELESIAFSDGYLYFTANANYENKAGKSRSLDGLYKVTKQLA